jgi:hypothetical protein
MIDYKQYQKLIPPTKQEIIHILEDKNNFGGIVLKDNNYFYFKRIASWWDEHTFPVDEFTGYKKDYDYIYLVYSLNKEEYDQIYQYTDFNWDKYIVGYFKQ